MARQYRSEEDDDDDRDHPSTFSLIALAPHLPLGEVMLRNRPSLAPLNLRFPLEQRLGTGAFGQAFQVDLGGKSVLKFTRDPTEAQACAHLLGKRSAHIVDIFGIWVFSDTHTDDLRGWYVVHREYLVPVTKKDERLIELIIDVYDDDSLDLKLPRPHHRAMTDKWRGYMRDELAECGMTGTPVLNRTMELLRQMAECVHAMHSVGIDWDDVHPGNLMRRSDGTMVVADVGFGLFHKETRVVVPDLTPEAAVEYARRRAA